MPLKLKIKNCSIKLINVNLGNISEYQLGELVLKKIITPVKITANK